MAHDEDELDPDAVIKEAIARGISAQDQYGRLGNACKKLTAHKGDLAARITADANSIMVYSKACAKAKIIHDNRDAINTAIFGDSYPYSAKRKDQEWSDSSYDSEYWQYATESKETIEKELDRLDDKPLTHGYGARRTALFDLLRGRPYDPPFLDPNAPPPVPHPSRHHDGQTDLGESEMRSSSVRNSKRMVSGSRRGGNHEPMPVAGYWMADAAMSTVHFAEECPTAPADRSDFQPVEEAMDPLRLAEEVGGRACGSCLRILEASAKEGFLFGSVSPRRTLGVWRDRIEYESHGFLGMGATKWMLPVDELEGVALPSRTKLVLAVPGHGDVTIGFEHPAEGDIAREAFERLDWSFED